MIRLPSKSVIVIVIGSVVEVCGNVMVVIIGVRRQRKRDDGG